jgi:hypothetical protein
MKLLEEKRLLGGDNELTDGTLADDRKTTAHRGRNCSAKGSTVS